MTNIQSLVFDPDLFIHKANAAFMYSDGQRYGQFLVNYLTQNHPNIMVPEEADCFFDDKKVKDFLCYIYSQV